jgi:(heptosyl)LPS beta-1,4-glucosyltransferase
MKKTAITAIIIAKNESAMLAGCLTSLEWCDAVLVIDNGSVDETVVVAEQMGARVIHIKHDSFDRLRTDALKYVQTPWVFYIDADERVTPQLAQSITVHLETAVPPTNAFSLVRDNYYYGHKMNWGGWQHDLITRIFRVQTLEKWHGKVHESPVFSGQVVKIPLPLVHFSHRNTSDGLKKTIAWTKIEAELLAEAQIKPITIWTILRKTIMEFWRRAVVYKGWRDGMPGLVEAVIQAINKALIYIQVWELQQKPSLNDTYQELDKAIQQSWRVK